MYYIEVCYDAYRHSDLDYRTIQLSGEWTLEDSTSTGLNWDRLQSTGLIHHDLRWMDACSECISSEVHNWLMSHCFLAGRLF